VGCQLLVCSNYTQGHFWDQSTDFLESILVELYLWYTVQGIVYHNSIEIILDNQSIVWYYKGNRNTYMNMRMGKSERRI